MGVGNSFEEIIILIPSAVHNCMLPQSPERTDQGISYFCIEQLCEFLLGETERKDQLLDVTNNGDGKISCPEFENSGATLSTYLTW